MFAFLPSPPSFPSSSNDGHTGGVSPHAFIYLSPPPPPPPPPLSGAYSSFHHLSYQTRTRTRTSMIYDVSSPLFRSYLAGAGGGQHPQYSRYVGQNLIIETILSSYRSRPVLIRLLSPLLLSLLLPSAPPPPPPPPPLSSYPDKPSRPALAPLITSTLSWSEE